MSALALDVVRSERAACAARLVLLDAAVTALEALEPPAPKVNPPKPKFSPGPVAEKAKPAKTTPPPDRKGRPVTDTARAKKGTRAPSDVTDDELRTAWAQKPANIVVRPWLTERFDLDPRGTWRLVERAKRLGLTGTPAAPEPDDLAARAKDLHAKALAKKHTDPLGYVVDSLNVPRTRVKELLGVPAGQR